MLELIETISELAVRVRRNGLLSIMNENIDNVLLKAALKFVVDGYDPCLIEKEFNFLILSDDFKGIKLLERYIICESALCIQFGCDKKELKLRLLSMLGENWVYEELFQR